MKRSFTALFVLALLISVVPQTSEAYVATKATSLRLNDHTLMFLLTYEFGHEKLAYRLPYLATRGGDEQAEGVGYDVRNNNLRTNSGEAIAVVLSDAELEDGMYVVPKNESREFTLVTFLTVPEGAATSSKYSISVNSLPFEFVKDGVTYPNHLNPGELKNYQTPAIGKGEKIGITQKLN